MKFRITYLALCLAALTASATSLHARGPETADEDSCYRTIPDCLATQSALKDDSEFLLKITNQCGGGVYLRYCLERTDKVPHCGSTGLGAGKSTWPAVTSTHNGTGRFHLQWVGVLRGSMAWVCAGKVPTWQDPPTFHD